MLELLFLFLVYLLNISEVVSWLQIINSLRIFLFGLMLELSAGE